MSTFIMDMGHATGVWCYCIYLLVFMTRLMNYVHTAENGITDVRFDQSMSQDSDYIGLVEVKFNNTWFHVCRNGTDYTREAVVICRSLGYVGGFTEYLITNIRRSLLQIICYGDESSLSSCKVPFYTFDVCPLNQAIGAKCFNDTGVRQVDGPNNRPNIGRVQVQYFGNWTNVCFYGTLGNMNDRTWDYSNNINLNVLCRQLGYPGSMLTFKATSDSIYNDAYIEDYKCGMASAFQPKLHDCYPDVPGPTPCPGNQYAGAACAAPGYVGCFSDPAALEIQMMAENMTIEICVRLCRQKGGDLRYAVLGAGNQCSCGTNEWAQESIARNVDDDMDCNIPCKGDKHEICGGDSSKSVYDVFLGRCANPAEPDNGRWTMDSSSDNMTFPSKPDNTTFPFGSVVTYQCYAGYILVGSSAIQCVLGNTPNETTWNASTPICIVFYRSLSTSGFTISPVQSTPELETVEVNVGNAVGIIAGASVGAVLFLVLIVVLLLYLWKIRKSDPSENREDIDLDAYEIPPTLSDQTPDNPNISNPADMTDNETYTALDVPRRHGSGPGPPESSTNHQSLDAASRLSTAEYQGIYHDVKMGVQNDPDVIYHEYMDPVAASAQRQPTVPVPPTVSGIDNTNGLYINVKDATNNRKP